MINMVPPVPPLPDSYWGVIKINDEPSPKGTKILAKINGEVRGEIVTEQEKHFGNKEEMRYLDVKGKHEDLHEPINFYIVDGEGKEYKAKKTEPETIKFDSGDVEKIGLKFETSEDYIIDIEEESSELTNILENLKKDVNALIRYHNKG